VTHLPASRLKGPVTLLRMRETYEKRMKINEIIFIRTKILWNASVWVPYIWRTSSVFSLCLGYAYRIKHTASEYAQNFWACLKKMFCLAVCQRMPAYASVCQRMPAYASVCDRAWNVYNLCLTYPFRMSAFSSVWWVIFFIRWHTLVRYGIVWQGLYKLFIFPANSRAWVNSLSSSRVYIAHK
jgi:hypothetical protein